MATISWTTDQVMRRLLPAEERRTSGSTPAARSACVDYPIPPRWAGKKLAHAERARPVLARRHHPPRRRAGAHAQRRSARRATSCTSSPTSPPSTRCANDSQTRRASTLMRVAIAGAGNVGLFIANDLVAAGHEVLAHRAEPCGRRPFADRRRARVARRRRAARSPRSARPGSTRATSSSPPPATTRTTSWSRSSPSRSSPSPASSPG